MVKRQPPPTPSRADVETAMIPAALSKLDRRIKELTEADSSKVDDLSLLAQSLCTKVNATLGEIFGLETIEYKRAEARPSSFVVMRVVSDFSSGISRQEKEEAFRNGRDRAISKLRSESDILRERLEDEDQNSGAPAPLASVPFSENEIFVVDGQDDLAREEVARLLSKAGMTPIILHEQANGGKTLIEKFEGRAANIGFAVVLLTPDDKGGPRDGELQPRARQNVIAELFYFMGKLGRSRVCALRKGNLEIPSDITGLVYTEMDTAGAWKIALVRELKEAGYKIRLEALLG